MKNKLTTARLCNALTDLLDRQPRFAIYLPPTIASNGEGGQLSHPQGENASEGLKTAYKKDPPDEELPDLCHGEPSRYVTRISEGEVDPYEIDYNYYKIN